MKVDMSSRSVTNRIKKTSELRRLCFALGGDRLKEKLQKEKGPPLIINRKSNE